MILIADSGSTKTEWLLSDGNSIAKAYTQGLNPFFVSDEKLMKIIEEELPANFKQNISQLFFYGAGCLDEERRMRVRAGLTTIFTNTEVKVESDLLGASRACCGTHAGIVSIIGTGSSVCHYNGKEIENIRPSLGYIIGDEGSGNHIGKKLLNDFFTGKMPDDLHEKFVKQYGITREKVLTAIYKSEFPNRFLASFSTFAADNIETVYCKKLVKNSLTELFENHIQPLYDKTKLPLNFNGSIAVVFEEILMEICRAKHMEVNLIIKSPGERLVEFHAR